MSKINCPFCSNTIFYTRAPDPRYARLVEACHDILSLIGEHGNSIIKAHATRLLEFHKALAAVEGHQEAQDD